MKTEEETTRGHCSSLATKRADPLARTARSGSLHTRSPTAAKELPANHEEVKTRFAR